VEVTFTTAKLARVCSSQDRMVRELGPQMARRLGTRLQELEAAATLAELRLLPQIRAHELKGNRADQISLDLVHPQRLIIQPTEPCPRTPEGGVDWGATTAVEVLEIADTHR
jgi:proteic killer suppression protein